MSDIGPIPAPSNTPTQTIGCECGAQIVIPADGTEFEVGCRCGFTYRGFVDGWRMHLERSGTPHDRDTAR